MKLRLAVFVLLLGAACSRPSAPDGGSWEYAARDGSFTAKMPEGWKVDEAPGENRKAAFFGPPDGAKPFSQLIAVSFYPAGGRYKDVEEYMAAQSALGRAEPPHAAAGASRGVERIVHTVFQDLHSGSQPLTTRIVAIPAPGGFYALEHTWPDGTTPSPAFEELLSSFTPGAAKK